jgi:hypothetical protein
MSQMGQERRFASAPTTSDLPLETDILGAGLHVSNVPKRDQQHCSKKPGKDGGTPRTWPLVVTRIEPEEPDSIFAHTIALTARICTAHNLVNLARAAKLNG